MGVAESTLDDLAEMCYSNGDPPGERRGKRQRSDCCHTDWQREPEPFDAPPSDKEAVEVCVIDSRRHQKELYSTHVPTPVGTNWARASTQTGVSVACLPPKDPPLEPPLQPESADEWRQQLLTKGAKVLLECGPAVLRVDLELGCLEVREHEALYPLAELRTCDEYSPSYDCEAPVRLVVDFADLDSLICQFEWAEQRAGFKVALDRFAAEARQERLPDLAVMANVGAMMPMPVLVAAALRPMARPGDSFLVLARHIAM
eukprot:CAMPEP_0179068080 /NCGR_PEP_ID=MMETSP0796-20121207/29822_1 /TAXON_ID=73915 /ORGANISM="Pyrodinium bahamense, Strain pbaha01" /LENGTH=258 /DNA_ID=CAMNT_0020765133 /DNA_START=22 /DNA_END=797 /DNA_ORIENTATION=-